MILLYKPRMLVFLIFTLATAYLCESKAFREETVKDRGKSSYTRSSGLHKVYGSQSNAEHWKNFYEPTVDGQAIYVPSMDQPGSYQEFLDAYYKTYTAVKSPVTPAPVYGTSSIYENLGSSKMESASKDYGYNDPKPSKSLSKMSASDDYSVSESEENDAPEVTDKTLVTEFSKNAVSEVQYEDEYDEPILHESLKESESAMTKPEDHNQYDQPVVKTKQKSKTHSKKDAPKKTTSKTKPQFDDYEKPAVHKTVKVKNKKPTEFSENAVSEVQYEDEYDEPILRESLKESESAMTKPEEHNRYDQPVVKTKLKSKTNSKKDAPKRTTSKTKPQFDDDYEKPAVHKTVKVKINKKPTKSSSKYGNRKSQTKSKGKRRKPYSEPRISEVVTDAENLSGQTVEVAELNKDQANLYELSDLDIEVKEKVKTDMKNKPIKVEENPQYKPVETKGKTIKPVTKDKPVKTKVAVRDPQYQSAKIEVDVKHASKEKVKTDMKNKPVKIEEYPENKPVETKGKVTAKPVTTDKPVKTKVAVSDPQYQSVKIEKVDVKPASKKPIKTKGNAKYDTANIVGKLSNQKDLAVNSQSNTDNPFAEQDLVDGLDTSETEFSERQLNLDELATEKDLGSDEAQFIAVEKPGLIAQSATDFRGLSMNSNLWSLLFNPNAEQNRLQQHRCITRSNETGICTYIQNCEVPQIATSLEQLLNNACVIDEIFIGVCCPEFPVETVKVHWDQTPSDLDYQIEDEFGHNSEDCGIRSNEASELQSWPWKAPLVSMSNGKIFCGGVLVNEDHVLTAAHCTTKIPKNQILVRLGEFDETSGDDYAVIEIKRHAQYKPRTMQNDVALLKLGRRIRNGVHISPICLPEEDDENDHAGETATLLGWRGMFGTNSKDPEFLEVMSNEECAQKLGRKISNSLLCTETRKESGRTCNADSGAPLVIEDDGKYEVIGILSWNRNDCDPRFPSTFSRVSNYSGWIKKHLS